MERDYKYMVATQCFTFNHAPYIEQTLQGFSAQETTFPVVYIIVDDASLDGESEVLRRWAANNLVSEKNAELWQRTSYGQVAVAPLKEKSLSTFVILLLKENYHSQHKSKLPLIAKWMNNAMYHALCEGDDYWIDPLKLQKQVTFLEDNCEYVLSYTNAMIVDANNKSIIHRTPKRYSGNITTELVKYGNFIITASACFRNYSVQWAMEKENIPFALMMGDKPLWIYYSTLGKIKYFREKMVAYRVLAESASHSADKGKIIAFKDNGELIAKFFNQRYKVGLKEKDIEYNYEKSRVRAMAKYSTHDFVSSWKRLIKKYPLAVFDLRLNTIAFIRIVLNIAI